MGQVIQITPGRSPEVESFGDVGGEARKFRLPLRDIGDLRYVFGELESEAGIASIEARAGELTNPTRACLHCGREFLAVHRPDRWFRVDAKGRRKDEADDWADGQAMFVPSSSRYCPREVVGGVERDCRKAAMEEQLRGREAYRSPAVAEGAGVRRVVCADGVERRIYDGVHPRKVPTVRDPELVEQCMYVKGANPGVKPTGADGSPALLDAERFASPGGAAKKTRHTRAWKCLAALDGMRLAGGARDVIVLQRVYGALPRGLPYHLWANPGGGRRMFDPKEIAPLAALTDAVEERRQSIVEATYAERLAERGEIGAEARQKLRAAADARVSSRDALDQTVRALSSPARRPGESKAAFKARANVAGANLPVFLAQVAREAEQMLVRASLAYRAARGQL